MATSLRYPKGQAFFDNNGAVLASGSLTYYQATTTTLQNVYSDAAGLVALPNPVSLNASGRAVDGSNNPVAIYLKDGGTDYKEVIKNSAGTTLYTDDNIPEPIDLTANLSDFAKPQTEASTDTSATVNLDVADFGKLRLANTASNSITYNLPSAASVGNGKSILVKKVSPSNTVTADASGSDTIDGGGVFSWTANNATYEFVSDGANWRVKVDLQAAGIVPQGYLTLVTGTPVHTADQSAKTSVFYTPDKGNLIPLYDGIRVFSELTLSLVSSHSASTIYDIFVWSENGVVTIGTGPAWSASTAGAGSRGTGAGTTELTRLNGIIVNAVSMTTRNGSTTYTVAANRATYVGSIFIDGTQGQVTCHRSFGQSRKWGLWNAYNRRPIILKAGDSTASWTYATATLRASNNNPANSLTVFTGLAEELFDLSFVQNTDPPTNLHFRAQVGIGVDSTTAASGFAGITAAMETGGDVTFAPLHAAHILAPLLGRSVITSLEQKISGTPDAEFLGGNEDMQLTARWMG